VNRIAEEMLRCCVNDRHDDWDVYLPMLQYVYNDSSRRRPAPHHPTSTRAATRPTR